MHQFDNIIIFMAIYLPALIILSHIPFMPGKAKSFGVNIPASEYNHPDVTYERLNYRNQSLAFGIVFALSAVTLAFLVPNVTIMYLRIGAAIQLVVMMILFLVSLNKVKKLKLG